jgi:hypothetical protein
LAFVTIVAVALTMASLLAAGPVEAPEASAEFGGGLGGVNAPGPGGYALMAHLDALWTVQRMASVGISVSGGNLLTSESVTCPAGTRGCIDPLGFYFLRGGPSFRFTPWRSMLSAFVQVSPQLEVDLVRLANGTAITPHFLVAFELGGDVAFARHFHAGPRIWTAVGPDNFSLGLALAFGVHSP